ncbi:MAG: hypothetical protein HY762_04040 [Planctomycetes bacterium]|nr:hypothetical protein [Planctomycetota bacterium]
MKSVRPVLIATFIILGFASLISQTICVRELLVIFFGNEVCLGIIFTVWLIGITLGALIGAYIADRLKSHLGIIVGLLILMALILPAQIYLIRILRYALDIPSGQHLPFTMVIYAGLILVTPFSFLIGLIFPLACRIYTTTGCDPAVQIGWVYVLEAVGSLLGGIIFTFYLVEQFQPFTIAFITNALLLLTAFMLSREVKKRDRRGFLTPPLLAGQECPAYLLIAGLFVINIVILFLSSDAINQSSIQKRWHSFNSQIKLEESVDSKYGNIAIGTLQDQYNLFENGKYVAAFPDDYTYAPLANFFLTEHPDPQDVLLIGGGLEGLIKEMLKHPLKSLHYVQIDPKLIETVYNYLPEIYREIIKYAIGDG